MTTRGFATLDEVLEQLDGLLELAGDRPWFMGAGITGTGPYRLRMLHAEGSVPGVDWPHTDAVPSAPIVACDQDAELRGRLLRRADGGTEALHGLPREGPGVLDRPVPDLPRQARAGRAHQPETEMNMTDDSRRAIVEHHLRRQAEMDEEVEGLFKLLESGLATDEQAEAARARIDECIAEVIAATEELHAMMLHMRGNAGASA